MGCLIVADDLTGACDAAGPFAARGFHTRASLLPISEDSADILAISTDTRDAPADRLTAALAEIAGALTAPPQILFKKIDSTLRGNAPGEVAAARDAFGCAAALVTPAFPRMRRIVAGGHLSIDGEPEFTPIHVASHFRCTHAGHAEIAAALNSGARMLTVDASTDGDLDRIVAAGLCFEKPLLWAGSSGLASALARTLPLSFAYREARRPGDGSVIFCVGSDHPVTIEQETMFRARNPVDIVRADGCADEALVLAIAHGRHAVLRLPRGKVAEQRVRDLLAPARARVGALMVTGGDTASLVYRALDMRGITIEGEIAPGIPYGRVAGGAYDGCAVVTKSGGFGRPGAFIDIADFFSCPKS